MGAQWSLWKFWLLIFVKCEKKWILITCLNFKVWISNLLSICYAYSTVTQYLSEKHFLTDERNLPKNISKTGCNLCIPFINYRGWIIEGNRTTARAFSYGPQKVMGAIFIIHILFLSSFCRLKWSIIVPIHITKMSLTTAWVSMV